jgi:hypothetical protein
MKSVVGGTPPNSRSRGILSAMIVTVHGRLHQRVPPADLQRRLEPYDLNDFLQRISRYALHAFIQVHEALLSVLLESRWVGKFLQLLIVELLSPRTGNPQKRMLHHVNVVEPLVEGFVCERPRMRFKGPPVFGIGPLLVGE